MQAWGGDPHSPHLVGLGVGDASRQQAKGAGQSKEEEEQADVDVEGLSPQDACEHTPQRQHHLHALIAGAAQHIALQAAVAEPKEGRTADRMPKMP